MGNAQRYRAKVVLHGDRSFDFSGIVQHGTIDLEVTERGSIDVIDLFEPKRKFFGQSSCARAPQMSTCRFEVFPLAIAFAAIWCLRGSILHLAASGLCSSNLPTG